MPTPPRYTPCPEHAFPTGLPGKACRWSGDIATSLQKRRRWESNPLECCFAGSRRTVWLQRQQASSPGIEPGPQPSQGCMPIQHTPRTKISEQPAEELNPGTDRMDAVGRAVSRTAARSGTLAGCVNQYPDLDLNQGCNLRRVACNPLHHRDMSTSARSRTPWSSFGGCRLSQEHTRVKGYLKGVEPLPPGSQPGMQQPLHHRHHINQQLDQDLKSGTLR